MVEPSLDQDQYVTLNVLRKHLRPKRSYSTLRNWIYDGVKRNSDGRKVKLEYRMANGRAVTTLRHVKEFLQSIATMNMECPIIGGPLHGHVVTVETRVNMVACWEIAMQCNGKSGLPANLDMNAVLKVQPLIDPDGYTRHFLVDSDVTGADFLHHATEFFRKEQREIKAKPYG